MDKNYQIKPSQYYSDSRENLFPYLPSNLNTVLDVGCSEGWFGKKLKEEKLSQEVWGVEPFPEIIPIAEKNLDKVIFSKIEDALTKLPDNYFDCIFFNDVLEHLVDPYTILEEMKEKLKPGGYIFASIPNILHFETLYQIIINRDWKYQDYGILDKTHLRFFTKKSMARMFEEAGYEVKAINGIHPSYGTKFKILNFLLGRKLDEMKYVQMVIRGQAK